MITKSTISKTFPVHALQDYLASFGIFSAKEINEFIELSEYQTIEKGDFFIREGKVCTKAAFIASGIFRSFYYSGSDEEITYCINFPNNFLTAYSSFITNEKTLENIQAITRAELLVIPKIALDRLSSENGNWLQFARIMAEQQYIALEKRIFQLQKEKAENRYAHMLANHPEYIQNIPLQYLASYLGITQRHLSRLRKQISI